MLLIIILKLGLDVDGFKREAAALKAFYGLGAVQIFSENNNCPGKNSSPEISISISIQILSLFFWLSFLKLKFNITFCALSQVNFSESNRSILK